MGDIKLEPPSFSVQRLTWSDASLGTIECPARPLRLRSGFGSGLARRAGDPEGHVWAIGDRGPNLKVKDAIRLYGLDHLAPLADIDGAKIMPRLDIGPAIAELRVTSDRVELIRTIRITGPDGRELSGLPGKSSDHCKSEPVFTLEGAPIAADPDGLDTEGIAAARDGSFWAGDEFGPSLLRIDADGRIMVRLVPETMETTGPIKAVLPAIAGRRQLNRGFEALASSPDEQWLFLAFQSPLAHPDEQAHENAAHVRIWRLDMATGRVAAQYFYPLDPPESFARDRAGGKFERKDIKLSELACIGENELLVLERGSQTTKIYRTTIGAGHVLPAEHLDMDTRPTAEQLSASAPPAPAAGARQAADLHQRRRAGSRRRSRRHGGAFANRIAARERQ